MEPKFVSKEESKETEKKAKEFSERKYLKLKIIF